MLDLTLCDDGVDYFQYISCLNDLVATGHMKVDENKLYSITQKGIDAINTVESSLAYSVRMKVDKNVIPYIRDLERRALVGAKIEENSNGFSVKMTLNDGGENLMELTLYSASREQAELMRSNFNENAEKIFNQIIKIISGGN